MTPGTPPLPAGILLLCLGLAACPPRAASGGEGSSYGATVARWTAQAEIYQMEDMRAKFAATLLSEPFRRAWVREQAQKKELGPQEVQRMEKEGQAEAAAHTVFILGMFVDPPTDNKLGRGSIWNVTLTTPTQELKPETIEDMGRPNENQRMLFPFLDAFWRIYKVSFPPGQAPGPWVLRVASEIGVAKLTYLQPANGPGEGEPHGIPTPRLEPEGSSLPRPPSGLAFAP